MGTSTASLQLYKPDPTEMVDVVAHLNNNWDRVENKVSAVGAGPSCILRRDTNFTVPTNVDTAIPWTVSERNDSVGGNAMWVAGATGITIRKAGQYTCGWRGVIANNAAGVRIAYVVVNGTDSGAGAVSAAPAVVVDGYPIATPNLGNGTYLKASAPITLNVGDVVKAVAFQDTGGNLDIFGTSSALQGKPRFWVIWEAPYIGT